MVTSSPMIAVSPITTPMPWSMNRLRQETGQKTEVVLPQPVVHAMRPNRVQSRIIHQDGERGRGRRIAVQHGLNVFADFLQHLSPRRVSAGMAQYGVSKPLLCNYGWHRTV